MQCQAVTSSGKQCKNEGITPMSGRFVCDRHMEMLEEGKALDFVDGSHQPEGPSESERTDPPQKRRAEKKVPCQPKSARS